MAIKKKTTKVVQTKKKNSSVTKKPVGGRRDGAGRKKGGHNKNSNVKAVNELLGANRVLILQKAITLATKKQPNEKILNKLLDKVLPNISYEDFMSMLKTELRTQDPSHDADTVIIK